MKKFIQLFNKVGGIEVLKQYCRAHVLFFAMVQTLLQGFSKKSLEIVRLSVNNKILGKLRRKYRPFIKEYLKKEQMDLVRKQSNIVWVCWLQGMENAPRIVQKCYQSLLDNIKDKEIILLTEENYKEYIQFPFYIREKIEKGIIKGAHMTDLMRLELLIKYGGTWIDATVFCSGQDIPEYMLNSELFVFQNLKPGLDGHSTSISNWFITACTNNPLLLLTRELLYDYWARCDKLIDYFIFHYFFQCAIETYPTEWEKVIPFSNATPHIILLRLFQPYDAAVWSAVRKEVPFHKLSYKIENGAKEGSETFYSHIIEM